MSNLEHLPTYFDAILFQSRMHPNATAVIYGSRSFTYRTFCAHIESVTRRVHKESIPAGSRVAISVSEGYLKWLVVIALARIGLVSVSVSGQARELEFVRADVVITDGEVTPGRRYVEVDDKWLSAAAADLPPFEDFLHDPKDPCRIVLSSGTTGLPKKALFSYGHLWARTRGAARLYGLNATTRLLSAMGIATIGGFWTPVMTWANGGTVILTQPAKGQTWARVLIRGKPNMLFTSTAQLSEIVNSLPADFWPMEHLAIYAAGSAMPLALNRKTRLRLSQLLFMLYGSTEAGSTAVAHAAIADTRPEFSGYVLPTVQVEIVDEQGNPVPRGTVGEVRIKADGLVDEYLEDTSANDGSFRDGWFHPGDAGSLDNEGGLSILGRTRELMNFGGVKIAPDSIEAVLARVPGIGDMAVVALDRPGRKPQPCAAVVAGGEFDEEVLVRQYKKKYPTLPVIAVARVAAIPRNEMGKVMRTQLAASIQAEGQAGAAAIAESRPR
ncbi:MAG TPA: class I adenylate-forming enzyme family protein [Ramlibacter sp.]|nr:class I adenylate-forming enzyme family protein [Ramlibacter sp.]